jgi:hypothetical protein
LWTYTDIPLNIYIYIFHMIINCRIYH